MTTAPSVVGADWPCCRLGEVSLLGCAGVAVLLDLHRGASARGARLHVTGADHPTVRDRLRLAGLDQVLTLAPSADELIAQLSRPLAWPYEGTRWPWPWCYPRG
jgi:ABC-type transporter Mla MlaB component